MQCSSIFFVSHILSSYMRRDLVFGIERNTERIMFSPAFDATKAVQSIGCHLRKIFVKFGFELNYCVILLPSGIVFFSNKTIPFLRKKDGLFCIIFAIKINIDRFVA